MKSIIVMQTIVRWTVIIIPFFLSFSRSWMTSTVCSKRGGNLSSVTRRPTESQVPGSWHRVACTLQPLPPPPPPPPLPLVRWHVLCRPPFPCLVEWPIRRCWCCWRPPQLSWAKLLWTSASNSYSLAIQWRASAELWFVTHVKTKQQQQQRQWWPERKVKTIERYELERRTTTTTQTEVAATWTVVRAKETLSRMRAAPSISNSNSFACTTYSTLPCLSHVGTCSCATC